MRLPAGGCWGMSPRMSTVATGVSAHCLAGFDPEVHLPLLAERGIRLFEIHSSAASYQDDAEFERLCAALARHRMEVNSLHVPYAKPGPPWRYMDLGSPNAALRTEAVELAGLCARRLVQAGGRFLVIHPGGPVPPEDDRRTHLDLAVDSLRTIRDELPAGADIRIAILKRVDQRPEGTRIAKPVQRFGRGLADMPLIHV